MLFGGSQELAADVLFGNLALVSTVRTRKAGRKGGRAGEQGGRKAGDTTSKDRGRRIIIEGVKPEVDEGRFAIKRTVGAQVLVEADLVCDGHDELAGALQYRRLGQAQWNEVPLEPLVNDRWQAGFEVSELGRYEYTLEAWVDPFATWRHGLEKKVEAGQDVEVDLQIGAALVRQAAERASGKARKALTAFADELENPGEPHAARARVADDSDLAALMAACADRRQASRYPRRLPVVVDRKRAGFGAWYEMFPRSTAAEPGRHGSFEDCERRLPYVASMGFDIVYLPPIHPIGETHRKGKNNSTVRLPGDPGSPWAIGGPAGGHKAVHPELGTVDDFRRFVAKAEELGLEVALDIAFQCSPDHPYVEEHPDWFRWRPDGTVQYAENPPKKYQDIYPIEFDTDDWEALWDELKSVFEYWIAQGVRIFRVDNPHTKPFAFWRWVIDEIKTHHPDVILLSEAFTRPKVRYALAKLGFTQGYTYFAWRNTKWELTQYLTELIQTEVREFFRPNFWPNTPDILHATLQQGGRPAFMARFVLAATLAANYGIYGPAFELCVNLPREPGREEYLNSEKYEIKCWDLDQPESLRDLISQVNQIRRQNPALQSDANLRFHPTDNEQLICYSKRAADTNNTIIVAVNLDSQHTQSGWVTLALETLGIEAEQPFEVCDLLTGSRYRWQGAHNYLELNPHVLPAHIFSVNP